MKEFDIFTLKAREQFLRAFQKSITASVWREMNFKIYTCNFLNNYGIKFEDVVLNREQVLQEIKREFPKNKKLSVLVEKAMVLWYPPTARPKISIEVYPDQIKVLGDEKGFWGRFEESLNLHQEFVDPTPEFCKDFLLIGRDLPLLGEIIPLFFDRLKRIRGNEARLIELFKKAIDQFDKPVNLDEYITRSKYFKTLYGGKIPSFSEIEDLQERARRVGEYIETTFQNYLNRKDIFASLEKIERALIANEAADILFKLLEGAIKVILWTIFNFERIQNLVPMDRTLGDYARKLKLSDWAFKYLRESPGHLSYEIEVDEDSQELFLIFSIQENYMGRIRKERKTLDEVISLIQILNASTRLFKTYMEAYIRDYEIRKKYNKSLEDYRLEQFEESWRFIKPFQLFERGEKFAREKNYEKALHCFDKVLKISPNFHFAWDSKGNCLLYLRRYEEARDIYQKGIELNPQSVRLWFGLALAQKMLSKIQDAMKSLDKILKLNSDFFPAWALRGVLFKEQGKLREADECLEKAIRLDPKYAVAYFNKACIQSLQNNNEQALKYLKQAIELDATLKKLVKTNSDFQNLREIPEFEKLFKDE